jgi:hypothetical protein
VYFNNVAIGVLDCCDYLTPARSVTWTSEGISGCDMTGLTATVECT